MWDFASGIPRSGDYHCATCTFSNTRFPFNVESCSHTHRCATFSMYWYSVDKPFAVIVLVKPKVTLQTSFRTPALLHWWVCFHRRMNACPCDTRSRSPMRCTRWIKIFGTVRQYPPRTLMWPPTKTVRHCSWSESFHKRSIVLYINIGYSPFKQCPSRGFPRKDYSDFWWFKISHFMLTELRGWQLDSFFEDT